MIFYTGHCTESRNIVAGYNIDNIDKPGHVVVLLFEDLEKGYFLHVDNYYTSLPLFEVWCHHKTDIVGTVCSKRKELPKEVMKRNLKKGEIAVALKGKTMLLHWKDNRNIRMMSSMQIVIHKGQETAKPTECI